VVWGLKTVRVSEEVHRKLTRLLGERMAKTGKTQTFNDIIEDLISQKDKAKA
jgi:predicted CopG family antitoxin